VRKKFEIFCFKNRRYGIPNLMLFISLGAALVYVLGMMDNSYRLYNMLCFNREKILQGEVWRLISYVLCCDTDNLVLVAISLFCYYSLGRSMENLWGTLRFNLFYFCGVIMQDIFCMIFGGAASVSNLNLSLFLAYATLYPNAHFLLFYVIPVKAWIFAVFDLAIILYQVITLTSWGLFPFSLYPLVALLNYFLFFGKDVVNVIPVSWRANFRRLLRKKQKKTQSAKTVPFPSAGSYQATVAKVKAPYTHQCTICGKTDISNPELEFRYCSRCNGYHCYCQEHISNHSHIQ
jgi:membrane associated rhomboid family serine protease